MTKRMQSEDLMPSEDDEQTKVVNYLRKKNIGHMAIPNGGLRNVGVAIKLKRTGVSKGAPDLSIPLPIAPYHGMFLEMKRKKGGVVTPEQEAWIRFLRAQGYFAQVARGADEGIALIEMYFGNTAGVVFALDTLEPGQVFPKEKI